MNKAHTQVNSPASVAAQPADQLPAAINKARATAAHAWPVPVAGARPLAGLLRLIHLAG